MLKKIKPLQIGFITIVIAYAAYAVFDNIKRQKQEYDIDYCLKSKNLKEFQNPKKRRELGLPFIDFENVQENKKTKEKNKLTYSLSTSDKKPTLLKVIYYCISNSESDIYILNDSKSHLKVEFFFENKKVRFSLKKNNEEYLFISEEQILEIAKENEFINNSLFYGITVD